MRKICFPSSRSLPRPRKPPTAHREAFRDRGNPQRHIGEAFRDRGNRHRHVGEAFRDRGNRHRHFGEAFRDRGNPQRHIYKTLAWGY